MKLKPVLPLLLLALGTLALVQATAVYAASPTIAHGCANFGTGVTTVVVTCTINAGDIIEVFAGTSTACANNAPSDSASDSFTSLHNCVTAMQPYYATSAGGATSVTCNFVANAYFDFCYVFDISGGTTPPTVGCTNGSGTNQNTYLCGSSFTPVANALVIGIVDMFGQCAAVTPGSSGGTWNALSPASDCTGSSFGFSGQYLGGWSGSTSTTGSMSTAGSGHWEAYWIDTPPSPTDTQNIQCTMANSGTPQATLALSGGSISPGTVLCDGASHAFTCTDAQTITATEPSDGANSRYRFSGGGTTTTHTCAADTWSITDYLELQQTYSFTPNIPNTWDATYSKSPTGTVAGAGSTTICTATLTSGTGTDSCSGWGDYNRQASFPASFASTGRGGTWNHVGTYQFTDTTGGNTHTVLYNLTGVTSTTLVVQAQAQPNFDTGMSWTVTGTVGGSPATLCTISSTATPTDSCAAFPDTGTLISFPRYSSTPPANSQWQAQPPYKITAPGGGTITVNYYKQWKQTASYTWVCIVGDTCSGQPTLTYLNMTVSVQLVDANNPSTVVFYPDANSATTITPTLTDVQNNAYSTSPTSWTITAANQVGNPSIYGLSGIAQAVVGWNAPDGAHLSAAMLPIIASVFGGGLFVSFVGFGKTRGDFVVTLWLLGVTVGLGFISLANGTTPSDSIPFALFLVAGFQLVMWFWLGGTGGEVRSG